MSQGQSSPTVTILQAHPSIDLSFPPSIHALKHITEMTASDVPLSPLALKSHYCAVYTSGGRVYHGHNEKHKYSCTHSHVNTHAHSIRYMNLLDIVYWYLTEGFLFMSGCRENIPVLLPGLNFLQYNNETRSSITHEMRCFNINFPDSQTDRRVTWTA